MTALCQPQNCSRNLFHTDNGGGVMKDISHMPDEELDNNCESDLEALFANKLCGKLVRPPYGILGDFNYLFRVQLDKIWNKHKHNNALTQSMLW